MSGAEGGGGGGGAGERAAAAGRAVEGNSRWRRGERAAAGRSDDGARTVEAEGGASVRVRFRRGRLAVGRREGEVEANRVDRHM